MPDFSGFGGSGFGPGGRAKDSRGVGGMFDSSGDGRFGGTSGGGQSAREAAAKAAKEAQERENQARREAMSFYGYRNNQGMMNALAAANGGVWGGSRGSWGASGGMTPGRPENSRNFRGYTANQVKGLIGTGLGWTLGDEGLGWAKRNIYEPQMQNHKAKKRNEAQMRENALSAMHSQVGKMDVAPSVRQSLADAVNRGDLAALDAAGLDTSQMRATHHGGGLFGAMANGLGWDTDDVETTPEATMGLYDDGNVSFNPTTGQWERTAGLLGPLAGVGLNIATGPIAKGVYEQTKSVPAAKNAATGVQTVDDKVSGAGFGVNAVKQGVGMLTGAPSPVGGALASGLSAVNNAARLSYAGIPAPDNPNLTTPRSQSFDGDRPQGTAGGGSYTQPINPAMQQAPGWVLPQWHWSQYA